MVNALPIVSIAGAGFSGSLLAVQLARHAAHPLIVRLFDASGFGRGVAYGTLDPTHLLNVRCDKMGAFDGQLDHFYRWLLAHEKDWRQAHPELDALAITPGAFLPRLLYGDYITSLLAQAERDDRGIRIEKIALEITAAEDALPGMTVICGDGIRQHADRLVLALGNLFAGKLAFEKNLAGNPRYTAKFMHPDAASVLSRNSFHDDDAPVVIIGSGLTMIDTILSLRARSYQGKIIAVSRHGLLPQPHREQTQVYPRFLAPDMSPRTALGMMHAIRSEIRRAEKNGNDWRGVLDSLRADTPALWKQLPESERGKLTHALAYWSTHRHRMPISSANTLAKETAAGTFELRKGRVDNVVIDHERLRVEIRAGGKAETIMAAHVINCAGPGSNIATSGSALLKALYGRGAITKGPLGMGIATDDNGQAKGNASLPLYILGPLLSGERFETIAVPEIRGQAERLAKTILASLFHRK